MGEYYNKTRNRISVTLRNGESISIGPKVWCSLSAVDEGTSSVADAIRKGFLVRAAVPFIDPPLTVPVSTPTAPSVVPASVPVRASAAVTMAPVEPPPPPAPSAPVLISEAPKTLVEEGSEALSSNSNPSRVESKNARRTK